MVEGGTTETFRPGNIQARLLTDIARQRRSLSTNSTVRVVEVSATDERMIEVQVVALPRADDGSFSGRDSLRTFLLTTVNWAEKAFTFTDTDGDAFTVRYWDESFELVEDQKDVFSGVLLFRVEV